MGEIRALEGIAPVTYVEGNNDARDGTDVVRVTLDGLRILLTHILPRPHAPHRHVLASLRKEPADVVKTLYYRPEFWGAAYSALVQDVMRGPSEWAVGDRELFAAFVSKLNQCPF